MLTNTNPVQAEAIKRRRSASLAVIVAALAIAIAPASAAAGSKKPPVKKPAPPALTADLESQDKLMNFEIQTTST